MEEEEEEEEEEEDQGEKTFSSCMQLICTPREERERKKREREMGKKIFLVSPDFERDSTHEILSKRKEKQKKQKKT